MRARKGTTVMVALALTAASGVATMSIERARAAGVPTAPTLQYAGTLIDNNVPVTGMRTINVSLWTQADGGAQVCTTNDAPVTVTGGRFRVPLDACLDQVRTQPNLWVQVSSGTTAFARTKLGAAPYAIEAERAGAAGGALAMQLMQLTQQVQQLQQARPTPTPTPTPAPAAVPAGAVMAFDLDACPSGWSELTAAPGRCIVGADGAHAASSQGGSDTVTLSVDQMPAHSHGVEDMGHVHGSPAGGNFVTGGTGFGFANVSQGGASFTLPLTTASSPTGIKILPAGGGKPIAITPPYLALRYCRKN
jgi:hypothetical protein